MTAAPPGYARAEPEALGLRPVTLLAGEAVLGAALLAASARELLLRLPPLFMSPLERGMSARVFGAIAGLALALLWTRRAPERRAATALAGVALASVLSSVAPLCWSLAFGRASLFDASAWILMAGSGAIVGFAAASAAAWLAPHGRALGLVLALLSPGPLVLGALVSALSFGVVAALPAAQAGAAVGLALALMCATVAPLERYLTRAKLGLTARVVLPALCLLLAVASAVHAERSLPRTETHGYGGDVVALRGGERQEIALVSHRSHFELYVDRTLKLSSIDPQRYAEALVHPPLIAAQSRRRVLLLGGGTGVVEREILRYPDVASLTVVVTDRALPELARRSPWLAAASQGALDDARVEVVEAEPIVWLARGHEPFDAIVADLEDPVGYRQSKHFTRHAFLLMASRLAAGGVAAVQAPSPLTFPRSFASIDATLRAADLASAPYRAAVPSIGDAGFLLFAAAGTSITPDVKRLPAGLRFITAAALPALFHFPADLRPALAPNAPANTLHHQPLVELYAEDNEHQPVR